MTPLVLLLLDACRWDYIDPETTPFLWKQAETGRHYRRVIPSPGFCERTEMLTGMSPAESGFFTAIGHNPEQSPYSGLKPLLSVLHGLEKLSTSALWRKVLRRILRQSMRRKGHGFGPYYIPLRLLDKFCLTEDYYDHRDPRAFAVPSLLSLVAEDGFRTHYDSFTALGMFNTKSDEERLDLAVKAAVCPTTKLFLVYQSAPDSFGHELGPDHAGMRTVLSRVDDQIRRFHEDFLARRPDARFMIIGDHGMSQVHERVDAGGEVVRIANELGLRVGKDFFFFLDSTMLRVWFETPDARSKLAPAIFESHVLASRGRVLTSQLAESLHVPVADRTYGDLIWWADRGVLVWPDFFHSPDAHISGMHGYDPSHADSHGTCIVFGPGISARQVETLELRGVFEVARELLIDE